MATGWTEDQLDAADNQTCDWILASHFAQKEADAKAQAALFKAMFPTEV